MYVISNHQRHRGTDRRTDGRQATATPFHAIAWDGKNDVELIGRRKISGT